MEVLLRVLVCVEIGLLRKWQHHIEIHWTDFKLRRTQTELATHLSFQEGKSLTQLDTEIARTSRAGQSTTRIS